jgi:hypothetical protein
MFERSCDTDSAETDEEGNYNVNDTDLLEGHRIVDMGLLGQNIAEKLLCTFCQSSVQLVEVERQGLGSEFVFHCNSANLNKNISLQVVSSQKGMQR